MKLLNLGCGDHFHGDWVNLDFFSPHKEVISHNLLKGIPFPANEFDVVYHSHVLEHFSDDDGVKFIKECYRVLKPNGILRIAVPDLEEIARHYLQQLGNCVNKVEGSEARYDWMMIELYDQVVRTRGGGKLVPFIHSSDANTKEYIYNRIGIQAQEIEKLQVLSAPTAQNTTFFNKLKGYASADQWKNRLLRALIGEEGVMQFYVSQYRSQGEIHQWMYDRFSLSRLMNVCSFRDIEVKDAFNSKIPDWLAYELDVVKGVVRKPDSLFMEGIK